MSYRNLMAIMVIVLIGSCFSSCKKFLESNPVSQVSEDNFYKTEADFRQAVVGAYSAFSQVYHGNSYYCLLVDLRADNTTELTAGGDGNDAKRNIDEFLEVPDNEHLTAFWQNSYILISRVNNIISRIDASAIDDQFKQQYASESKVLRALAYFNLVRLFGDVPLVTSPITDIDGSYKIGRTPVADVYTQIIKDLTEAAAALPPSYDDATIGKATLGAAQSLLGIVYLTQKNYPAAVAEFKKVVDAKTFSLLPVYADLFKAGQQGNKEAIWQVQFKTGTSGLGSNFPNHFAPTGSEGITIPSGGAYGFNQPTEDIANAYTTGDVRRNNIADGYTKDGAFVAAKYIRGYVDRETGGGYQDSGADWYVLRYADILLMYAEALNEADKAPGNEAYRCINLVRERAGLGDLSGLNYTTFKAAVYNEERLESPFEGHRWFDLLRTDRGMEVMNAKVSQGAGSSSVGISKPIQKFQLLYPIPAIVVSTSGAAVIKQNDGY
ncbi:RagB/SusD family nutrient uptake outer membrane protein [Chitinophaga sp. MM2321]|uniref:RagB/SusD family nutrient uptake outer membrane protein n=1 Tax=Chitinophaga sp. MM2321 TaxID=3137178 RepID=UPI0032D5A538